MGFIIKLLEVCKSESDPIRSDFGTKIVISDWIDKVVSRSRIENFILLKDFSDRNSLSKLGSDSG